MLRSRIWSGLCVAAMAAGATALAPSGVAAHEDGGLQPVRVLDDCDPTTFNEAIGPGTCVGDGDVTFQDFLEELEGTGEVGKWKFNPDDVGLKRGEGLRVMNLGGEFHTFTEVAQFGGGCIEELNHGQPPVDECKRGGNPFANGALPVDHSFDITLAESRKYRFMCLVHPWMRTTVVVEPHH